jgi:Zn-dependent protease
MSLSNGAFRIITIRGIEIRAHWSWSLIFVALTWSLAESGFFGIYSDWPTAARWALGVVTVFLFFLSVIAHELAHSLMAQRYGMQVPSITLFAFGGVSSIATEMQTAGQEFRVAVVGPLTSWAVALVCGGLWLVIPESPARTIAWYIGYTNAVLGLFNLLPGFPLDGGRVLRSAIWGRTKDLAKATRIAANGGRVVAYGLMILGVFVLWQRDSTGLWYILIGLFLQSAANSSYRELMAEILLRDVPARLLMVAPPAPVEANMRLIDIVDSRVASSLDRVFLVSRKGVIAGLLTVTDIVRVPRDEWMTKLAGEVMVPAERVVTITPDTGIVDAMRTMQEHEVHQLPVLEDGRLVGMVTLAEVVRQAEIRLRGGNGRPPRPLD